MGVYEELGLKPIINASGAVTRLGGAPMSDAVLAAFCEAARQSVPLEHLQAAASKAIAQATAAEAGLEAVVAQDAQHVLGDPGRGVADKAYPLRGEVGRECDEQKR